MLNLFSPVEGPMSQVAGKNPNVAETASPVQTRLKWYESPIMFITVIVVLLVAIRFVERKVG